MVYRAMPTMPASELRKRQAEMITRTRSSPILLTHNGHAAGILVHPQVWNDIMDVYEQWLKDNPPTVDIADCVPWEEFQRLQEPEVVTHAMG